MGEWISSAQLEAEQRERGRLKMVRQRAKNPEKFRLRDKEYNRTHPERRKGYNRNATLKTKYGFSIAEYTNLYKEQGGCCAICRCPVHDKRNAQRNHFSVDHDHITKLVRGLLCSRCNSVIEDARFYAEGLAYLKATADRVAATTENIILLRKGGGT